ncbi:hypothetical protein [Ensifer sp.]|uniref:hypothetical protein n=1 Tax=Ensifer sp. TaxID=1872086 RepID=UPI0028A2C9B5|nr:hypothetical protein [Ensifer sp.]
MATKFDRSGFDVGPEDIVRLQKIFDRICYENRLSRRDARASRLAKVLMDELRGGNLDEVSLMERGRWFCASAKLGAPGNQRPTL